MLHSRAYSFVVIGILFASLFACGDGGQKNSKAVDARAALIADESADENERLAQMESLVRPVSQEVEEALLLVMKDRSQQAFLMVPEPQSPLGYRTVESEFGGPDTRAEIRWTAVETLERLGTIQALPDLISALYDRHEVVRHFAARALWRLGCDKGLPILLEGLAGKALSNESANRVLKEISGEDFGFDTDAGWKNKAIAINKWRAFLATMKPTKKMAGMGVDADLDRRVRYLVAILGQHQFLFMEQARRNLAALGDLAVDHIESGLDDELLGKSNQQLRAYAVQALAMNDSKGAADLICRRCAVDESAPVRSRAALAMGAMKSPESLQRLMAMIKDRDEGVVIDAIRSLGARGSKDAIPLIKKQFDDPSQSKRGRLMAAFSLVRLGQKDQQYRSLLESTMAQGMPHEKAEMADLLTEWQGDLYGWDERVPAQEQSEALARWRSIFAR